MNALVDEQLSADIAEAHRVVGRLSERGVVRKDNRERFSPSREDSCSEVVVSAWICAPAPSTVA